MTKMKTMAATGSPSQMQQTPTRWSKNRRLVTIVLLIAIVVSAFLGLAAATGTVLYTTHEDLRYSLGTYSQGSWYAPSLNNSQGVRTASIEMLFPSGVLSSSNVSIPMMVSVWHTDTTHLDSFDLTLSSPSALWVWLNPPSGGNPMQITNTGNKVVISIPNLAGVYGSGTVTYNLIVQPLPYPRYYNYALNVDGRITLHDNSYLLIQHTYSAEIDTQLQIAPNGTITG